MASPHATFTELVTTTFRKHRKSINDAISNRNVLYARLTKKGNVRTEDGGLTIVEPLDYAENSTYQRYSGYDTLNIGASDVISAAEFPWRQIAIHVVASGLELRTNSGGSKIINLAKAKMKNATRTFKNNFSSDLYSAGSLSNQISGLQALVSDLGTGTVGGINSTTWTFWKSILQSAASPLGGGAGITPGITTMESLMLPLWMALTRGADSPDLIISSDEYFVFYDGQQNALKRYTGSDTADGGFVTLKYKGIDVVFDGGSGIPAAHMYMLNTDYLYLVAHKDANMSVMDTMHAVNMDASVIPILWMGNLVVSNRQLQGLIKA